MGRALKRVPMNFDWPLHCVWKGYINPYKGVDCPYCNNTEERRSTGLTKEAENYYNQFYGFKCKGNYITNPYNPNTRYNPNSKPYNIERWEYDYMKSNKTIINELFKDGIPVYEDMLKYFLTHNFMTFNILQWHLTEEYCRRNGYEVTCPHCKGDGILWQTPEIEKLHESFEYIEPPTGDGYQLWETTSEGSPVSPVFASLEELCEWCADNATTFASFKATKEEWMKMLNDDFVCHQEGNVIMF